MNETFAATHRHDPHRLGRSGWLRAAVLGATDGLVSISALLVGVAASGASTATLLTTGIAGLVAGAMSIAASEYISVSSQADIERAEVERERRALKSDPEGELDELAAIYRARGLTPETARQVAKELTRDDALGAHLRDEVGLMELHSASPKRAAAASLVAFASAGLIPVITAGTVPASWAPYTILAVTLAALLGLGALGAGVGGAGKRRAMIRTIGWGAAAMAATYIAGNLVGASFA
ncbi:MAG: VIT1/CCC1 transporter family protein [Pseudomonadota bacterium]